MTPALLNRMWSLVPWNRNSLTLALMVVMPARLRWRKINFPDKAGCRALMFMIAVWAFMGERVAMQIFAFLE
jgi:hypothetical protein